MSDQSDSPEQRRHVARMLVILSQFMFLFCLVLAQIQGAGWVSSLIIAGAGVAMCLGASLLNDLRGRQATGDLLIVTILLRLLGR